jgi:AAA ATPase domain
VLTIRDGSLGPVPPSTLEIRPFTVLIGKQGTGKSLVAQVLYFFRALPFLISYQEAITRTPPANGAEPRAHYELVIQNILSDLRSSGRSFADFANPTVALGWQDLRIPRHPGEASEVPTLHLRRPGRRVVLNKALRQHLEANRSEASRKAENAIFVPAERIIYSQIKSPAAIQLLSLPSTFLFFAEWMERAAKIQDAWEKGVPDTIGGRWIRRRSRRALAGEAQRRADAWTWKIKQGKRVTRLAIDMASSGQRASFSLVLLAEALLSLRASLATPPAMTIYVEEPEIHLHPEAQVAMVEILAYLVNEGFHVVVTTHSLTVLYALNVSVHRPDLLCRALFRRNLQAGSSDGAFRPWSMASQALVT